MPNGLINPNYAQDTTGAVVVSYDASDLPLKIAESLISRGLFPLVRERRVDEIPVIDAQGHPVGILDVQDLIAMKAVQE